MKIGESIDEIKSKVDEHSGSVIALNEEMKKFREELNLIRESIRVIKEKQANVVDDFHQSLFNMKELNKDFKRTIYDFTILRKDIHSQILEKFDNKLNEELINHLDSLKQNAQHYQDLKDKVSVIVEKIKTLGEEINKFNAISRNIRKEDFELTKYAQMITQMDKEKLNLMKKIDTLEHLIAKMRRSKMGP